MLMEYLKYLRLVKQELWKISESELKVKEK